MPRALEAICLKAMAVRPADRYPVPRALADDLERWLADEPVTAWREPMSLRARRWIKQHQRLVAGAGAAAVMGAAALVAITTVISFANRRLSTANTTIRDNSAQIARQNRQLEQSNSDLALSRAEAERERDQAKEVTDFLVSSFRKPDPAQDGEKVTIAEVLGRAVTDLEGREKLAPLTRAAILSAVGQAYNGLGLVKETPRVFDNVFTIRQQLLGDAHVETIGALNSLGVAHSEAGHYEQAIPLLKRVLELRREKLGARDPATLVSMNCLASCYKEAGQLDRGSHCWKRR